MKRVIVVTGGAGYIGSHIAYILARHGYTVVVIDTLLHNQPFNHPWAHLIKDDFACASMWEALCSSYQVDAVIHCAASIEVGKSITNPALFYENNVAKTLSLLNTLRLHNIRYFIFSSSCALYGNPLELPLKESHPKNPVSPYGKTKHIIEYALEDYAQAYGLRYSSLRYFNAAGAMPEERLGEFHKSETHVIPLLIRSMLYQEPFKIYGTNYQTPDGTAIRDYVHVRDIADAHLKALEFLMRSDLSDVYNLGTGAGHSVRELIEALEYNVHRKIKIEYAPRRAGDPDILIADPSKAMNILRWKPSFSSLDFILRSALRFEELFLNREKSSFVLK